MLSQVRKRALVYICWVRKRTSRNAADYVMLLWNPLDNRLPTVWGEGTVRGTGVRENKGTRGGRGEETGKGIGGQRSQNVICVSAACLRVGAVPGYSDLRGSLVTVVNMILAVVRGKSRHRST